MEPKKRIRKLEEVAATAQMLKEEAEELLKEERENENNRRD